MAENINENKYRNGKIYKIVSDNTNNIYIGSTTTPLRTRLIKHESAEKCFNLGTNKQYCYSFEILRARGYDIQLIEDYPCNNKKELTEREGYYIKLYENICVNKKIDGRTQKQYYLDNIDHINRRSFCDVCNCRLITRMKYKHEQTAKHIRNLEHFQNLQNIEIDELRV